MPAGRSVRAGGWGYVFGDEGGGFDITRQALRAALRHRRRVGPADRSATPCCCKPRHRSSVNEVLHRFYTDEWPRSRVATLARQVDAVATEGDGVARDILLASAQQLAAVAGSVRRNALEAGRGRAGGVHWRCVSQRHPAGAVSNPDGVGRGQPLRARRSTAPRPAPCWKPTRAAGLHPQLIDVPEVQVMKLACSFSPWRSPKPPSPTGSGWRKTASTSSSSTFDQSVNPPADTRAAANLVKELLERHGIPVKLLPSGPGGQVNLLARLPGRDRSKKPLLLLNHLDVVPVDRKAWGNSIRSPLIIRDGDIWGRGTMDMKGIGTPSKCWR